MQPFRASTWLRILAVSFHGRPTWAMRVRAAIQLVPLHSLCCTQLGCKSLLHGCVYKQDPDSNLLSCASCAHMHHLLPVNSHKLTVVIASLK